MNHVINKGLVMNTRQVFALAVIIAGLGSGVTRGQQTDAEIIEPDKREVLRSFEAIPRLDRLFPLPATPSPDDTSGQSEAARRITGDSVHFEGTGGFSLKVQISGSVGASLTGYIVDSMDDSEQDMVILADLSQLSSGTRTIGAACTDLHKHFPASGARMASVPWTEDSTSHWAYWVRQAVVRGRSDGYSRDEIQANVWYITDRNGDYNDMRLLRAINYSTSGPSKNAAVTFTGGSSGGPRRSCGAGFPFLFPLLGAAMAATRVRRARRPRNV